MNYNNIFKITDKMQKDGITLMQLKYEEDSCTCDVTEDNVDTSYDINPNDVTKLAEYIFLTKQMDWRKGLKLFGEWGEEAIDDEL